MGGVPFAVSGAGFGAGRPALDPRSLATLWVWALLEGIGSARALARRCETDLACRWALGGERVSHHTLSDFPRQNCGALDALLSQTVSALHQSGAVSFDTLLVDGTKVKARAGFVRGGGAGDGEKLRGSSAAGGGGRGLCGFARCGGGAGVGGGLLGSAATAGAPSESAGEFGRGGASGGGLVA